MVFLSGSGHHNSNIELLLKDQLSSMGDAITSQIGTIAWIEAYVFAEALNGAINYINLLSSQLTPSEMSVFAERWANIFGLATLGNGIIPSNLSQLQTTISFKQALFGTYPNLTYVTQYLQTILGNIFINIEYNPEVQSLVATNNPAVEITLDGYPYLSPLSQVLVRVWQPRDNQDNSLMLNSTFINTVDSYKTFVQDWIPAYIGVRNMQLQYDGYDGYHNYLTGFDTITVAANSTSVVGVNTKFTKAFDVVGALGYLAPLEVVDDTNTLQTFLVSHVTDDTHLTISVAAPNNVTARTYRMLGIQLDVLNGLDSMLFSQITIS